MGINCYQNNVVCDGYVKYTEAEIGRLVAILKTKYGRGSGGGPCWKQQAARLVWPIQFFLWFKKN